MTDYLPVVTGQSFAGGTPNAQQAKGINLFLPNGEKPARGYEWILAPSGAGYLTNDPILSITSTVEVLHEALERNFAVVTMATTFADMAVPGLGKFFPPVGATLNAFLTRANCYRDVALGFQQVQRLSAAGTVQWNLLNHSRGGMFGRSGPGHMSLFNALSVDRDPAVDPAYVNAYWTGYTTRPRCVAALSTVHYWPFFDQDGAVTSVLFFHAADGDFDGVPAITKLSEADLEHQKHASPYRYGFDFASYPGLGGIGEQNINARMPVLLYSPGPSTGIESQIVTDGFGDGDYHSSPAYPISGSTDSHGMWHPVAGFKKLLELSDWHAKNSVLLLNIDKVVQVSCKDLLPNVKAVRFINTETLSRHVVDFFAQHLRGDPVPFQLVDAVEDVLRGITKADNYYTTMGRVFSSNEPTGTEVRLPAARVFVSTNTIDQMGRMQYGAVVGKMIVDVVVWDVAGNGDQSRHVERLYADVQRAILANHQLEDADGNARCLHARVVGYEPMRAETAAAAECGVAVRVEIDYRMDPNDLTIPV